MMAPFIFVVLVPFRCHVHDAPTKCSVMTLYLLWFLCFMKFRADPLLNHPHLTSQLRLLCTRNQYGLTVYSLYIRRDSSVGIATGWTVGVRFLAGVKYFSLLLCVQTGSGGKAAGPVKLTTRRSLMPTSRIVELYLHSRIRIYCVVLV
jgi:hypothetical protein